MIWIEDHGLIENQFTTNITLENSSSAVVTGLPVDLEEHGPSWNHFLFLICGSLVQYFANIIPKRPNDKFGTTAVVLKDLYWIQQS